MTIFSTFETLGLACLKFIYSEKAKIFCETVNLSYVVPVKFTVEILENFVAFSESEHMNF